MSDKSPDQIPADRYDVAITGGGLAGLALSIQLAKAGYRVAVYEKETYPFHKVCGEYISLESWNFLEELGLPLSDWNLPAISRLLVSAPNGNHIEHDLPQGGFGISRFKIDEALSKIQKLRISFSNARPLPFPAERAATRQPWPAAVLENAATWMLNGREGFLVKKMAD
jgi:hypothetical protein